MVDMDYLYTEADEETLDELMAGHPVGSSVRPDFHVPRELKSGLVGVLWEREPRVGRLARPLALVANDKDIRRLCGRYSQLRSDLSPLTSWCHLLTPRFLDPLGGIVRRPDLGGLEAPWVGLIVAEALLSAEESLMNIRISACFATQSFAVGRATSLWGQTLTRETLERVDWANSICRNESTSRRNESRSVRLRAVLYPIWSALTGLDFADAATKADVRPAVEALRALRHARSHSSEEAAHFARPLVQLDPEHYTDFERLSDLTPEMRLSLFDRLVRKLSETRENETQRRLNLAMLAAYLATVAAGGAPSLALTESLVARWPEITAWAYVIGGIGEEVVWTSAFDGLGRLVARELSRPFRLDEPPTCDCAFEELVVLADPKLRDPLVHLKIKRARQASIALFPGVNASVPLSEQVPIARQENARLANRDPAFVLAENIWGHIKTRLDQYLKTSSDPRGGVTQSQKSRPYKRKPVSQGQLPLPGDRDKS